MGKKANEQWIKRGGDKPRTRNSWEQTHTAATGGSRSDGVKEGCLALSISSLPHEGKETDATRDAWER